MFPLFMEIYHTYAISMINFSDIRITLLIDFEV